MSKEKALKLINEYLAKQKKEELSTEKVELSLIKNLKSDLDRIEYKAGIVDKLINEFKQASSQLKNKYESEFRGVMMDIEESQETAKRYVEEIANVSKEIGADSSKIVGEYRSGKSIGDKAIQRADNYYRIISKL